MSFKYKQYVAKCKKANKPPKKAKDFVKIDWSKEKSLTKQCFKDNCDIKSILKKYSMTGAAPIMHKQPNFGDFAHALPYQEAVNLVMEAQDQFNSMPSELRNKFQNDPAKFLAFMEDENNTKEMIKLGLIPEPVEPAVPRPSETNENTTNAASAAE